MAARSNERPTVGNELLVKQEGRRPLFSNPKNSSNNASTSTGPSNKKPNSKSPKSQTTTTDGGGASSKSRPSPSKQSWAAGNNNHSPSGTRIPRPAGAAVVGSGGGFGSRKPLSLSDAFKLAAEEDSAREDQSINGSPSPAPRPWRSNLGGVGGGGDDLRLRQTLNEMGKSPAARLAGNLRTRSEDRIPRLQGERLPDVRSISDEIEGMPRLAPGIEDAPFPGTEQAGRGFQVPSPEKSFAWDIDQDFTAGDLQVSESPRIRITHPGSRNTKIEEIRSREMRIANTPLSDNLSREALSRKVDEILDREKQAETSMPVPHRPFSPRFGTAKIDEVRKLESQGLSRRAFAQARLEEIKEQNAMTKSLSPEEQKDRRDRDAGVGPGAGFGAGPERRLLGFDVAGVGKRVPDTPITIFKSREIPGDGITAAAATATAKAEASHLAAITRREPPSQDLLRRLARAASSSPAASNRRPAGAHVTSPPDSKRVNDKPDSRASSLRRTSDNIRRTSGGSNSSNNPRPTVGFQGIWRRAGSNESSKSKRSSMNSEPDPTDRITAEMNLFAPGDYYSERGSVRAPSPLPEDDDEVDSNERNNNVEATPKPIRQDPLSMPTPQIIGAYVETPVTARVDRRTGSHERSKLYQAESAAPDPETIFRDKADNPNGKTKEIPNLEKEETVRQSRETRRPRSQSRSRSRSVSGKRPPPVKNTAKLPTARQDLLELQKIHNMDDATIDDLEDILAGRGTKPKAEILALIQDLPTTEDELEEIVKREGSVVKQSATELEQAFDRMTKQMENRLPDVKNDVKLLQEKMDRERLSEKKPSFKPKPSEQPPLTTTTKPPKEKDGHQQQHDHQQHHNHPHHDDRKQQGTKSHQEQCPLCIAAASPKADTVVAYVHFPIPRFYRRVPTFQLTILGMLVTLLSIWYAAESAVCAKFCRPLTCSAQAPCIWSYDDPTFGYAIPVKLDQWTTGGRGRNVALYLIEEAGDWAADIKDAALGRSILDVNTSRLSFEARRRHRRRLAKKGLLKPAKQPGPELQAKWDGWKRERLAKEKAKERGGMMDDEFIGEDERLW